jgi:hypothetical protein
VLLASDRLRDAWNAAFCEGVKTAPICSIRVLVADLFVVGSAFAVCAS